MLHAVEHSFGVACTHQGGPRADNGHNVAAGISALSVGILCQMRQGWRRRHRRERWAVPPCVCGFPAVRCSLTGHVKGISPQQFTLTAVPRIKKTFLHLRKPSRKVGTSDSRLTISLTNNYCSVGDLYSPANVHAVFSIQTMK